MKTLRIIMASAAMAMLSASCLNNEDPYNAGFMFYRPTTGVTAYYANNVADSLMFFSWGPWAITRGSGADWCHSALSNGQGGVVYAIPMTLDQNTTGQSRSAEMKFTDTQHPNDAHATLIFWQYATRGDGTLGSAADVKAISGNDGSRFTFSYDEQHRPTDLLMTWGESSRRHLQLSYNDRDSMLTVTDGSITLSGSYRRDYQPERLVGSGDTIGYYAQYYPNGMPIAASNAFNVEHHTHSGKNTYYSFLLGGQSLMPDSLHCADSLRIAYTSAQGTITAKAKLSYSRQDNRRQSADVNQLIFGTEQCNPYMLLSLFRYARQTSIVSQATGSDGSGCRVETTHNADGSVAQMTVRQLGSQADESDEPLVYTFEY